MRLGSAGNSASFSFGSRFSMDPCSFISFSAVFGPMPLTPSGLKSVPTRMPMSMSCSCVMSSSLRTCSRLTVSGMTSM